MAQSQQQRQKALERKAAKRKQKAKVARVQQQMAPTETRLLSDVAPKWQLLEALVNVDWQNYTELTQILVARKASDGRVAAAAYLVDLACLGVKSSVAHLFMSAGEYQSTLRSSMLNTAEFVPADINLIAKILRDGSAFAAELGFSPDPDFKLASRLIGDADPDVVTTEVPLGDGSGKPVFIPGPDDNVLSIMARLERKVGKDGFTVLAPFGDAAFDDEDEDE